MRDRSLIHGVGGDAIVSVHDDRTVAVALTRDQRLEAMGTFTAEQACELAFALMRLSERVHRGSVSERIGEEAGGR